MASPHYPSRHWIIVRHDSLQALQPDGSWGFKSSAKRFVMLWDAEEAATHARKPLPGVLVTVDRNCY